MSAPSSSPVPLPPRPTWLLAVALLAGCASGPLIPLGGWPGNFEVAGLKPGASVTCYTDPCRVVYEMPPGTGNRVVRANNLYVGDFPAGEVVELGAFYYNQSPVAFTVDDTDARPAYLWIAPDY
jgi:hypothetical protein